MRGVGRGRWIVAKPRDGTPGNLGDPALSVGDRRPERECRQKTIDPGPPSVSARMAGARERMHKPPAGRHGTGWRTNKPKGRRSGGRSARIVLMTAGNRGRRDPTEGRGAPHVQTHWRETRGDSELRNVTTKRKWIAEQGRTRLTSDTSRPADHGSTSMSETHMRGTGCGNARTSGSVGGEAR